MAKKNYTKKELINKVYQNLGFSKNFSSIIINDFFDYISSQLIKTKKVKISSFGTFDVISKNERIGRNPKTKVEVMISSRNVVTFKVSEFLHNSINSNMNNSDERS